jgi:hypothetical protein
VVEEAAVLVVRYNEYRPRHRFVSFENH